MPYTLSVAGGAAVEQAAEAAPRCVLAFQLYRFWHDDHKIGFDLVRRAQAVDAKVLALTLDVPVRTTRSRNIRRARPSISSEHADDLRNE